MATSFTLRDELLEFAWRRTSVRFLHLNVHGVLLHSDRVFSSGEFFVSVFRSETKTTEQRM
jgi:hypothetical protein